MWGYLGDFATRQDKVRQAVSLWKAVQTRAWRSDARPAAAREAPAFSFRAINHLVRLLTTHDASWDAYFLGLGVEPLKVTYEELADAPEPVLRRVFAHIGIEAPASLDVGASGLAVQADELSESWVERVHAHLSALEGPEPARRGWRLSPAPARRSASPGRARAQGRR